MLKKNRIVIIYSLLIFHLAGVNAQFQTDLYIISEDTLSYPVKFTAGLNASGFFNNKEFFGTAVEGYTLTGNYFQPFLKYNITGNLSLKAGIHLLHYHGQNKLKQVLPVFSIAYNVLPDLTIRFGSFNKGSNLMLPEPLYMFESQFSDLLGNGLQIVNNGDFWESVTWLDWLSFIEPGDPFREEFIFGHSGNFRIWENGKNRLCIPVYLLANHKGGQINDNDEPVETRFDLGTGLKYIRSLTWPVFNRFSIMTDYYLEKGVETNIDGSAFYTYSELNGELFTAGVGYFKERNWESILGEPLFFSPHPPGQNQDLSRDLILFKAGIGKKITSGSSFMLRFEGYYDMGIKKFQYTYGIHIVLNEWLKLL